MLEDVIVRPETVDDFPAVREVVNLAFQNDDEGEADLIDALRAEPGYTPELSLVAELNGSRRGPHHLQRRLHRHGQRSRVRHLARTPCGAPRLAAAGRLGPGLWRRDWPPGAGWDTESLWSSVTPPTTPALGSFAHGHWASRWRSAAGKSRA